MMTTRADFPKQEKNPEGETHEDIGMISYDTDREKYIFRQYFNEGFMCQYVADISEDGMTIVFTSELIESYVPGFRVRLTFRLVDEDTFEQELELGPPEKDFFSCRQSTLHRKK